MSLSFFLLIRFSPALISRCTFVLAERKIYSPERMKQEGERAGFCEAALIGAGARNLRPDFFLLGAKIIFFFGSLVTVPGL